MKAFNDFTPMAPVYLEAVKQAWMNASGTAIVVKPFGHPVTPEELAELKRAWLGEKMSEAK